MWAVNGSRDWRHSPNEGPALEGFVIMTCLAVAAAIGGFVATSFTSGLLSILCGLFTLVATGCALFLLALPAWLFVMKWVIEGLPHARQGNYGASDSSSLSE